MAALHDSTTRNPLIAIVSTHTTRHLRLTLLGLAVQHRRADLVVVSCDNELPEIEAEVRACASAWGQGNVGAGGRLLLVQRPHAGVARLGQVRNNAVRTVLSHAPELARQAGTLLVFFDGDILCPPDGLATHERLASLHAENAKERRELVITHRVDLTPEQTERVRLAAETRERDALQNAAGVTDEQLGALRARARRYRRQSLMRRLGLDRVGLAKPHKPKVLGANFGVSLRAYLAVNGCDERFEGYGQEDDDLTRRLYQLGVRPAIAVDLITNLHLYHPTRAPGEWANSPGVEMLHADAPTRCVLGVDNPKEQGPLRVVEI